MKAQGDRPFLHAWDCGVQSKASLGWTWAGCGAQRTAACPPSVSLGPHLSPLQPADLGFLQTNGRAQRGSVWGTGCPANEVHRGPAGCTPDRGSPPWKRLCLSTRVPCRTLKAPVNTEEGLTLRVTRLSVCVSLASGLQNQKTMPGLHECSA